MSIRYGITRIRNRAVGCIRCFLPARETIREISGTCSNASRLNPDFPRALCIAVILSLSACATLDQTSIKDSSYKDRAITIVRGDLTVTVAVPTLAEAKSIYGVDLASKGMQPVWIEVRNDQNSEAWLLSSGLDPEYYSASEAVFPFRLGRSDDWVLEIDARFQELQIRNPLPPRSTTSGFLIVNRDEGFKAVDIDIISSEGISSFAFATIDPSFKGDFTQVDFKTLYSESEVVRIEDEEALRRVVEHFPCCTANRKETATGDPLNLVIVGNSTDIFTAFIRRGWHGTEAMSTGAMWRTAKSFLSRSRYRYSPVSPLFVLGRRQDIAFQKARSTIHERNHLRLWLTPYLYRGDLVWLGQISRDIGVKFTIKSPTISTHVIDPDVDEARRYLIEDLAYSQAMARLGYARGVGSVDREAPRYNLVGDPYFTDGLRAVMFFEPRPHALSDITFINGWEIPSETRRQTE